MNGTSTPKARRASAAGPALQIICLASGGGPNEDNITGFLVRSLSTNWSKNSVLAVDAGSHLAAITRLLEKDFPLVSRPPLTTAVNGSRDTIPDDASVIDEEELETPSEPVEPPSTTLAAGPFAGLPFPHESARANALHVVRECVSTYLITHPHLDHLSGFVVNTAGLASTSRPKRLAALPSTVNAIKAHIFNDVIWPNLTDEDGGVGFVSFQRLPQGGNNMVGEGPGKGYIEVCDGLCVKGMKVSHGHCMRGHQSQIQYHRDSEVGLSEPHLLKGLGLESPRRETSNVGRDGRTPSITQMQFSMPGTPGLYGQSQMPSIASQSFQQSSQPMIPPSPHADPALRQAVVDSTAYFIRDDASGREVLIFGDVEPDLVSLNPRTAQVWAEAAPKIAAGSLRAVLIECSYDDSQGDAILFGHLAPRHLVKEMQTLAAMVKTCKAQDRERRDVKKRKRSAAREARAHMHSASVENGYPAPINADVPNTSTRPRVGSIDNTAVSTVYTTEEELDSSGLSTTKRRVSRPTRLAGTQNHHHRHSSDVAPHSIDAILSPTIPPLQSPAPHVVFANGVKQPTALPGPAAAAIHASTGGVVASPAPLVPGSTIPGSEGTPIPHTSHTADATLSPPLEGLQVVIIHMKDTLRDGPLVGENILRQLKEHEEALKEADGVGLGCDWIISQVGESYWV